MGTVTGLTKARMLEIEAASVVAGAVSGDNLYLTRHDGSYFDAGEVRGPQGDPGDMGVSVPAGGTTGQVLVKLSGTDYDYAWSSALGIMAQTLQTSSYTLTLADAETVVMLYSGSPTVVTVPKNADVAFPLGTRIRIAQAGAGSVSIAGAVLGGGFVGVMCPPPQIPTLLGTGAIVELIKVDTDGWILNSYGNLAESALGFQTYYPNIHGTVGNPNLGTSPVQKGYYIEDNLERVIGGATVRWGTGTTSQGSGYWMMKLPVEGKNYDDEEYSPIGNISIGSTDLTHKTGMLHFCGITGFEATDWAIGAIHGGLFASATFPSTTKENVHYHFAYQKL